jgi:DNA-binding MarR family transcriptional regulator/GNAT superfamily N-acetyltransferase
MNRTLIDHVRGFNRTVTQRVGALEDAFLARDRPLGQARLLWEIGAGRSEVRALRSRLELDSGYLSRLLRALEADGLVVVEAAADDARVRTARLTSAGLVEWAELDRRADDLAGTILDPLNASQRDRLVTAMAEVQRLLTASMVRIAATDPRHPHARHCVRAYYSELADRFDDGFDPSLSLPADDEDLTPPAGLMLVATLRDIPVGCGALKHHPGAPTELKRMWVSSTVRGVGLGRRLLTELEAHAAAAGAHAVRLETNRTLSEAVGLYRAAGYREVEAFSAEPYAHHWFEKSLDDHAA